MITRGLVLIFSRVAQRKRLADYFLTLFLFSFLQDRTIFFGIKARS